MLAIPLVAFWAAAHWRTVSEAHAAGAAVRIGLTPAALAAAGCDGTAANRILALIGQSGEGVDQVNLLDLEWQTDAQSVVALADALRDPTRESTDDQVAAYAQAEAKLAGVESSLTDAVESLRALALSECPPPQAAAILRFGEAIDEPGIPVSVFAHDMSREGREDYAAAVAMSRLAAEQNEELAQELQDLIADVHDDEAVKAAQANIDAHLEEVAEAFDGPG